MAAGLKGSTRPPLVTRLRAELLGEVRTSRSGNVIALRRAPGAGARPARYRTRWIPVSAVALALALVSLGYVLFEPALLLHRPEVWRYPSDLWLTVRAAQWLDWGAVGYLYSSHSALVTLPGFPILLAPAVALSTALHLGFSSPGINDPKPTALLLLLPYCLLWSSTALFALDRLAAKLQVSGWRRNAMLVLEGGGIFSAVTIWGHPEDVVAFALMVWGMVALDERRLVAAGWLIGAAISMQLYVLLLVPLFAAVAGRRAAPGLVARAALLPGVIFLTQAIPNFGATTHALLNQANFPHIDHPTPWAFISPSLGQGEIAAGPARLVGAAAAVVIAVVAARRRPDLRILAWVSAGVLATRCFFESVIDPYYVMPTVAICLVLAATSGWRRAVTTIMAAIAVTLLTYRHEGAWPYWLEMSGLLVAMLLATGPRPLLGARHRHAASTPEQPSTALTVARAAS